MSIKVVNVSSNVPNLDADVQGFTCQIIGDDSTESFVLNLSKTPFDFKFTAPPSSVDLVLEGIDGLPDVTGIVSSNDTGDVILTCTVSGILPSIPGHVQDSTVINLSGTFIYNE